MFFHSHGSVWFRVLSQNGTCTDASIRLGTMARLCVLVVSMCFHARGSQLPASKMQAKPVGPYQCESSVVRKCHCVSQDLRFMGQVLFRILHKFPCIFESGYDRMQLARHVLASCTRCGQLGHVLAHDALQTGITTAICFLGLFGTNLF